MEIDRQQLADEINKGCEAAQAQLDSKGIAVMIGRVNWYEIKVDTGEVRP